LKTSNPAFSFTFGVGVSLRREVGRIKTFFLLAAFMGVGATVHSQTLAYRWAFTNASDTTSNSAASYAWVPGTGNLTIQNVSGNVFGVTGADGVNPMVYFTNSIAGLGVASGAFVANGQGYNSGNTAIAMATNLCLGTLYQYTATFWVQLSASDAGQFPRLVNFAATANYDASGKGTEVNGTGTSVNTSPTGYPCVQNGVGGPAGTTAVNYIMSVTNAFVDGLPYDGTTWVFEAVTYDGTTSTSNFVSWVGLTNQPIQIVTGGIRSAPEGAIQFGTNAYALIGGNNIAATPRSLSVGAIADVRIYSGVLDSNQLETVRAGIILCLDCPPPPPPITVIQPQSGNTYVGGSRTFSVIASGYPAVFTYLWRSNGIPMAGATNSSLTLTQVQLSANGASFVCSVSNIVGGTNSAAATLTVLAAPPTNTYAGAVYALNPFSFWLINEPSNSTPVIVYDYVGGRDGVALDPTNMAFLSGPSSPLYSGFPATNTSIETIQWARSRLNLGGPGSFVNSGMTICGWVNVPAVATAFPAGLLYNIVSDVGPAFGLIFDGNGNNEVSYQWGQNAATGFNATGLNVPTNRWTFVALVISTNLTPADIDNAITADTNATVYVGAPGRGLLSATDSTATTGDLIDNGSDVNVIACGRSPFASARDCCPYDGNTAQFSSVAVFYSALSPSAITHLYQAGVGVSLTAVPDPSVPGNLLLKWNFGTLQEATDVTGPYTDVAGPPVSPHSIPMTGQQQFYRIRN
jgi:hypothetical protein